MAYCDPYVPSVAIGDLLLHQAELTPERVRASDLAIVVTHHSDFDFEMVVREAPIVVDTRNATRPFAHLGNVRFL